MWRNVNIQAIMAGLLAAGLVYGLFAGLAVEAAGLLASCALTAVPVFWTEWRLSRRRRRAPDPLLPPGQFGISARRLVIYGALLTIAAFNYGGWVGATVLVARKLAGPGAAGIAAVSTATSAFVGLPILFLIGRWIGRKAMNSGAWTVVAATLAGRLVMFVMDQMVLLVAGAYEKVAVPGGSFLLGFLVTTTAMVALSFLGYWRGRRQRLSTYLNELLATLPAERQHELVDLAYREVQRSRFASPSHS